ncbi:MAG: hypothetical protein HOL22_07225 [Euryarchaeota archaeon]|jgi:hypothetical protein|nr:hypothetical protein [Euryarchaeota archaeon]MBT5594604.1 hypothetical protein [Euryarchaeota archaeon]MBT6844977.1 hypothetical protein [Euryarchaeota archaeon]MBT7063870.1 hypothetical protein [Euryarchaeota archaeon]
MATLYDIRGTQIYAGRGKYSRRARSMIEQRTAYKHNDEGNLVVYVPENQPAPPSRPSTLEKDAHTLKRDAQNLGQQLGLGLDEIEVRRETPEGVLVAHLKQMTPALVAGLDGEQAAKLMQSFTHWMLQRNINVYEHEELVRNLHELINDMRVPAQGASLLNRDDSLIREDGVNVYPGTPTSNIYNELWIHAFLPPNDHCCRPSVAIANNDNHVNVNNDGRIWFDPALQAGPEFVCENLHRASNLAAFRQGRHGIVRVFLPYNPRRNFVEDEFSNHGRDNHPFHEREISSENEPWSHCLQRFVDACANIKNTVRTDLRLFIHRGSETPQEVNL